MKRKDCRQLSKNFSSTSRPVQLLLEHRQPNSVFDRCYCCYWFSTMKNLFFLLGFLFVCMRCECDEFTASADFCVSLCRWLIVICNGQQWWKFAEEKQLLVHRGALLQGNQLQFITNWNSGSFCLHFWASLNENFIHKTFSFSGVFLFYDHDENFWRFALFWFTAESSQRLWSC